MYTTQTFLQKKVFGNFLGATGPLQYRRDEWRKLIKGRERSARLIAKSLLGVPSAHVGENDYAMWCFQLPKGSLLVVYLQRGTVTELAARIEDEEEVQEAVDFLMEEFAGRLRQL